MIATSHVQVDPEVVLTTLKDLVNIASPTGAEGACAEYLASRLDSLGMTSELQRFAPGRANAIGTLRGSGGGRDLLISGHIDTSYNGDEEGLDAPGFKPHAVIDGDYLVGLGAGNMKCGLAAAVGAASALAKAGLVLEGDLLVAGVGGEIEKSPIEEFNGQDFEGYGTGTRYLVAKGVTADAAIVGEATGFRVSLGHVGSVWLRITVHGDLLHTALSVRDDVTHAIYEAQEVIAEIRRWIPGYQERTEFMGVRCGVGIGAIRGGDPWRASRTPHRCRLYLDVRYPPGVRPVEVKRELHDLLAGLRGRRPHLRFTLETYVVASPSLLAEDSPIVQVTKAAATEVLGRPTATTFRGPMDDSAHLMDAGIPTINFGLSGPDNSPEGRLAGERVRIDEVVKLAQVYVAVAMRFCTVPRSIDAQVASLSVV